MAAKKICVGFRLPHYCSLLLLCPVTPSNHDTVCTVTRESCGYTYQECCAQILSHRQGRRRVRAVRLVGLRLASTHMHTHTCTCTHTHAHTHAHMHTRTHTHTPTHAHMHTHTPVVASMHTHAHTHAHAHTHTYTHTHAHKHTCRRFSPNHSRSLAG